MRDFTDMLCDKFGWFCAQPSAPTEPKVRIMGAVISEADRSDTSRTGTPPYMASGDRDDWNRGKWLEYFNTTLAPAYYGRLATDGDAYALDVSGEDGADKLMMAQQVIRETNLTKDKNEIVANLRNVYIDSRGDLSTSTYVVVAREMYRPYVERMWKDLGYTFRDKRAAERAEDRRIEAEDAAFNRGLAQSRR